MNLWTFVNPVFITVRVWLGTKQVRTPGFKAEKDLEMPADLGGEKERGLLGLSLTLNSHNNL